MICDLLALQLRSLKHSGNSSLSKDDPKTPRICFSFEMFKRQDTKDPNPSWCSVRSGPSRPTSSEPPVRDQGGSERLMAFEQFGAVGSGLHRKEPATGVMMASNLEAKGIY